MVFWYDFAMVWPISTQPHVVPAQVNKRGTKLEILHFTQWLPAAKFLTL